MIKFKSLKKVSALALAGVMMLGIAGCAKNPEGSSSSGDSAKPTSPAASGNDESEAKYTNPYKLNNLDVFEIDASKYVDVSGWKEAKVTADDIKEDEYKILYAISNQLSSKYGLKTEEIKDRPVQGGDTVTIDFKGYVDDKELEGGSGKDFDLTIGSGSFIPGYEEGLVGHKTGEEVTLNLKFPDPYPNNTELSGKDVKFVVNIKKITGFGQIKDEDIKKASENKYNTYAEFEKGFREGEAKAYQEGVVWQKVMAQIKTLSVCDELKDDFINTYLYTYGSMGEYYNMSVETILYYYYGFKTVDEFKASLKSTAEDYAAQTCAVLAIAEAENITVTEDELAAELKKQLESSGCKTEEELAEKGTTISDIKFSLLLDKVEEKIYSTIEIK